MSRVIDKINTILNESSVTIDKMSVDGKVKGKIKVNVGDTVGFKAGSKPAKGKNKFDMEAGTIDDIKGDLVHINSDEEGSWWMRAGDLYWEVEDKQRKRGVSEQNTDKEVYEAGADPTGTWIAYKSATVFKRFKNREEMKKFIASNDGYKSASSEYFADKIKKKK